jgi:Uma2 family endonuclease
MRRVHFNSLIREEGHVYEHYAAIPEESGRYELLDGELHAMPPAPSLTNQVVSTALQKKLYTCDEEYIVLAAPLDVILSPYSVVQPDIVMVHRSRTDIIAERGITGPPDLVVEILSPWSVQRDRGMKMNIYAFYGVTEYWIVDAANGTLEQYFLQDGAVNLNAVYIDDTSVTSPQFACVSFSMTDVMKQIPRFER